MTPKYNPSRLKEVLRLLDLTQQELADNLGMQQASISNIVSGKTKDISISVREYLRDKHNVNLDYLYNLSDEVKLSVESKDKKIKRLEKMIKKLEQIIDLQYNEIERLRDKKK